MNYYEAAWSDELEQTLIRLSGDWEAENSTWGYRQNGPEDLSGRRLFLAEENGEILAYLFGLTEEAERTSCVIEAGTPYFEVEELYVVPARRSQGIGRSLFRLVEETLKSEGQDVIMLSTATKNARAILHFYLDELDMTFWNARLFKRLK